MKPPSYEKMPNFIPADPKKLPREAIIYESMNLLLHNRYHAPQDALITLEVNHIYLGNGGFILTAFRPDESLPVEFLHEFLNNLELYVRNTYEDCGLFYVIQMDAQVLVIHSFPRLTEEQHRDSQIYDLTERYARIVVDNCKKYWGVWLYAAVGSLVYTADNISDAFFFLTDTLEYKAFTHNHQQILYKPETIQSTQLFRNSNLIQCTAASFANEIYAHSFSSVPERVRELVHHLIASEASSMRNFHFCILIFVQTFSDELLRLGVLDRSTLATIDILGEAYNASDIEELKEKLISLLMKIQTIYVDRCSSRQALLVDQAKEYIDANFQNQTLSVTQIADTLGQNQSSLSTLFKLYTGETLISYIRARRVSYAKSLLSNRKLTLEQIAEQAGFGSINTMYRAFKSVEGLSPGKLR